MTVYQCNIVFLFPEVVGVHEVSEEKVQNRNYDRLFSDHIFESVCSQALLGSELYFKTKIRWD